MCVFPLFQATIVQVFTQDPLYKWSLSPAKIQQLQPLQRRRSDAEAGSAVASSTSPLPAGAQSDDRGAASSGAGMAMGGGGGGGSSSSGNLAAVSGGLIEGNTHAHRALIRFQQKLAGQEANGILSVSGQVAKLISDARDPANLCSIFVGWRPWL